MLIATLIAADRLSAGDISEAKDLLSDTGAEPIAHDWLEPETAVDVRFTGDIDRAQDALAAMSRRFDVFVQRASERERKLFVADMDSTMITVECLDELADYAGFKSKVSAITERAMRGELDFVAALDERVALLADMDADTVTRCHEERVSHSPGAKTLVQTFAAKGVRTVLVSGGFTLFADRVASEIGFDRAVSNRLDIVEGKLTGRVLRPIIDGAAKLDILNQEMDQLGLSASAAMAIGDGANDLPMIERAGIGVAYRGKAKLRAAADARIEHGDLTALLYAQGYPRNEWVED